MPRFRIFLAPVALLLIGAAAAEAPAAAEYRPFAPLAGWRPPVWRQVRIQQHFQIRIIPGTANMPPWVIEEIEEEARVDRAEARRANKCLDINNISTLQAGDGNELLLFLRDDRIIGVTLEKHCSARDFYAGFYIERNADGAICAGRDTLQSRSGANCKVKRLHELIRTGFRRFP